MLKVIGWALVGAGLVVLAVDVMETGGGDLRLRAFGAWWFRLHPDSLQLLQPAIERHLAPVLWDPVMLTVLQLPFAALLAALGGLLLTLGRRAGG